MRDPSPESVTFIVLFLAILCSVVFVGEFRRRRKRRAYIAANAGEYAKAIRYFDEMIAASPQNAAAFAGRGACYMWRDQWEQGIDDCLHAVKLGLNVHENYGNLGTAFFRKQEFDDALANLSKAIHLQPRNPEYHRYRGYAHFQLQSFAQAAADFSEVIRLVANDATAYLWRGHAHYHLNDFSLAIADFTQAIARCPDLAEAYLVRADANYRTANFAAALADGTEALRLKPDTPHAWNLIAWIAATCPEARFRNGVDAVAKANRACELALPREWNYIGTLAAAFAEAGQFDEAVRCARESLAMAPASERVACEQRMAAYERGEPTREVPPIPTQPSPLSKMQTYSRE